MSVAEVMEYLLSPSPTVVFVGLFVVLFVPILLHIILSSGVTSDLPVVLLTGGPFSGKTAISSLFETGKPNPQTYMSRDKSSIELTASRDSKFGGDFRENAEDTTGTHTKFLLVDTPGHPKLRHHALQQISPLGQPTKCKAIVFVVDAADLSADQDENSLSQTAAYLYDILWTLQKATIRQSKAGRRGQHKTMPVLIAANKMDLFTAMPGTAVKTALEAELTRIRDSKSKGLLDSGVGVDDVAQEDKDDWLGEFGAKKFTFAQMQEFDVEVDIIAGDAMGSKDGPGAEKWWQWIVFRV